MPEQESLLETNLHPNSTINREISSRTPKPTACLGKQVIVGVAKWQLGSKPLQSLMIKIYHSILVHVVKFGFVHHPQQKLS